MALGAVVGAALTDHSARAYALWIDGLDVIRKPGTTGNGYGTPIDTVVVKENAPGSVSQLTAVIDDPNGELAFDGNAVVMLQDLTNDWTRFLGFLTAWTPEPWPPSGRKISIVATGIEVVLDWAKVGPTDITIAAGTATPAAIQSLMSFLPNGTAMPLRAFAPTFGSNDGTQALPLGNVSSATLDTTTDLTIRAGTTLREAIRAIQDDSIQFGAALPTICTVDFYAGLRLWRDNYPAVSTGGGGYAFLGVNLYADNAKPSNLQHATDAGSAPGAVLVIGTGVTATVSTGNGGETAVVSDSTITTVQRATSFGLAYLAKFRASERGEFDLEDMDPATSGTVSGGDYGVGIKELHPGSAMSIVDAQIGLASNTPRNIGSLEHRFYGTKETMHVSYGGPVPSGAALLRRLTRTILS